MNLQLLLILFLICCQPRLAEAGIEEFSHNSHWRYSIALDNTNQSGVSGTCPEILTAIKNLTCARAPSKGRTEFAQALQVTTDTLEEYSSEYRDFLSQMAIAKGNRLLMNQALKIAEKNWRDWIPPELLDVQGLVLSEEGVITGLKFWTSEELASFLANGGAAAFERLNLTALDLDVVSDSPEIFNRLPEFKTLEALSLQQCNLGDSAYLAIAKLKTLKMLNISENDISSQGAKAISKVQTLEHLGLNHIRLNSGKFRSFLRLQKLQSIDAEYGQMDQWLYKLGKVGAHQSVRRLNIARNDLDEEDASMLVALFPNLEDFDLESNHIGEIGIEAVSGLRSLKRLNVQSNRIFDAGARYLEGLQSLEWLDASYNDLTNQGAFNISRIPQLRFVDLSNNAIGNEGAVALAALPLLQDFNMRFNRLGRAGHHAIESLREKISGGP